MELNLWDGLAIEDRATPRLISDDGFRQWMAMRRIFVSSVMDSEMKPARQAARERIEELGGHPEMWEVLAPRDQHSDQAYFEGVGRSNIFLLLLGHSYGVSDDTGFSPIEKENNRARELGIHRMLFQPEQVVTANRDGKLNRLVSSLYNEISGAKYVEPIDLAIQLERQLRGIASAQEAYWIKLGKLVFPGTVKTQSSGGRMSITVTARVGQYVVRQHITQLGQHTPRDLILTWGANSYPVSIDEVLSEGDQISEESFTIVCHPKGSHDSHSPFGVGGVTFQSGNRTVTPSDQAKMWTQRAIFGQPVEPTGDSLLDRFNTPAAEALPAVLHRLGVQGWLAEGITRLYVVEGLVRQYGATFQHMSIGPATASGVRVEFTFSLPGYQPVPIAISGIVPIA